MKAMDFENAILALGVEGLVIDEMKMACNSGGHVRQVNGHKDTTTVVWDASGKAFTSSSKTDYESFVDFQSGSAVIGRRLKRATELDLKFV